MVQYQEKMPKRANTPVTAVPALSPHLSQEPTPAPSADDAAIPAPNAAFDFGSIAIFPPEPQVGPAGGNLGPAATNRIRAQKGGGAPLAFPVQERMEGALGHNFADVRVHADSEADALNSSLGASAFTLGSDIFLGTKATRAGASGDNHLLAHELTHVVQQRGAASPGPLTVDPVDAPAEREAAAIAHAVSAGDGAGSLNVTPTQTQATIQREVVSETVTLHAVASASPGQPAAPAGPATPADIAVQNAFNPMDINHKLLRAIDQSHVKLVGVQKQTEFSAEHLNEVMLYGGLPIYKRHVDFDETVAALNHLTADQIKTVRETYQNHEQRSLDTDLFGMGESGYPSDLTEDQSAQLRALLGGTAVAAQGASVQEQQTVASNTAMVTAAELHRLLHGDLEDEDIERVMSALRHDAKTNAAVMAAYAQLGGDLRTEVFRMGVYAGQRAWKLLDGDVTGADAFKVTIDKAQIEGIDAKIKELQEKAHGNYAEQYEYSMSGQYEVKRLQKERAKLVEDIEKRAEQAGAEASAGAQGDPTAAVQERMKQVLGDPNATAALVGGDDATLIRAMASDDPVPKAAAQLHKLAQSDDLKAETLTVTLRGLRTEAENRAQRAFPKGDPRIESETKRLADDYFTRIRDTYNSLVSGDEKKFGDLTHDLGDEGDQTVNIALMQQHGKLDDVTEIVLALRGDRKDTATVERVLRDKNAGQIGDIKKEYRRRTGRPLDQDLFGAGATHSGEANEANDSVQWDDEKRGLVKVDQGKASGTSRLNLEDYLQRPGTEGGPAEAGYILDRAEREFAYTIDNRGATGAIRDAVGNEERDLLNESIGEVRSLFVKYCNLIGWYEASTFVLDNVAIPASVYAGGGIHLMAPQMVQSPQAQELIVRMRMARATIRGDRDAYEKATAALRAIFEAVAIFVLQAVLSALLSPAAAAAIEALEVSAEAAVVAAELAAKICVNVASSVGANIAVHGSDYSVAMLKADLLGGLGGTIGGEAVGKMLGPVAKGLTQRLGPKASQELVALATTAGSIEGGAWAQGESGDLSLQNLVKTHLMGKAAGAIATKKVPGTPYEGPATESGGAPAEPAPQEGHPGTTPGNEPRIPPTPTGETTTSGGSGSRAGSQEPTPTERPPSATHGEEPTATSAPAKTGPTETDEGRPGGRTPNAEDPTLVDAKPVDEEPTLVDWEPEVIHELPDGSAMWMDSPKETRAAYNESIRKDSRREVAIYRNTRTGETVIVQGTENAFKVDLQVAHEALPGPAGTWELEAHYHPINEQTGVTRVPQRLPTSTNGDFAILEWESQQSGNRPRTSRIDFVVEGDKRGYTEYSFDPGAERPYKINYPDPVNGERVSLEFKSREAYEEWFSENFPGYRANIDASISAGGGAAPVTSTPENEGGVGTTSGSRAEDETAAPDASGEATGPEPEDANTGGGRQLRTPELQKQAEERNKLVASVRRLRNSRPGDPATRALATALQEELNEARTRLRNGEPIEAQLQSVREALEGHRPSLRSVPPERLQRFVERLRNQRARSRNPDEQAELDRLIAESEGLQSRMQEDPSYDPRADFDVLRRQAIRAGRQDYSIDMPLHDEVLRGRVEEYFRDATAQFRGLPGGDVLRNRFMEILGEADHLTLSQSPRQAGVRIANTPEMRLEVLRGIEEGRYPPEYVAEFTAAQQGSEDGWPRTPSGRAWEVDHVMELWTGGPDDVRNYLALDPRLHNIKSEILEQFRLRFRDELRQLDEDVDFRAIGDFDAPRDTPDGDDE